MENYIITAMRDARILIADSKDLNLTKINYKLSMQSNDYRCLVELFKQYLCVHRINLTEFQCTQIKPRCLEAISSISSGHFSKKLLHFEHARRNIEIVHSV